MKPQAVIVCVDRFDAPDGRVWAVRSGRQWLTAHTVRLQIEMQTVFRGAHARQPKAYLEGVGVVHTDGHGTVTIANA